MAFDAALISDIGYDTKMPFFLHVFCVVFLSQQAKGERGGKTLRFVNVLRLTDITVTGRARPGRMNGRRSPLALARL